MITRFWIAAVLAGALALAAHAAADLPWVVALDGAVGVPPRAVLVLEAGPTDALMGAAWLSFTDVASVPADVTKLQRTATSLKGDITLTRPGAVPVVCAYRLDATVTDGALTGRFAGTEGETKVEGALRWGVDALPYGHRLYVPSAARPAGFRGDGSGHFPGATPPLSFSEKDGKNVRWSVKMPSWSQSSPIVVGKYVITAAEPDTTLCADADTGKILWQDTLGILDKLVLDPNQKGMGDYVLLWSGNGYSWPCSDGARVVKVWVGAKGTSAIVCYDVETGKRKWMWQFSGDLKKNKFTYAGGRWAWRQEVGAVQHAGWGPSGYGSPQMCDDLVIYRAGSALMALDKESGAFRWSSKPGVTGNAGCDVSPLIVTVGTRRVLVTDIGTVLDPKTGEVLGNAIPSIEKGGQTFSRLWGLVEKKSNGEINVGGITPISDGGTDGLLAFGPDWPRAGSTGPWDQVATDKNAAYCYLAVKLGFDTENKLTTTLVFPDRAVVGSKEVEYGNAHLTLVKNQLIIMPGYSYTLTAIALDTGKMAFPAKTLWKKQPPFEARNGLKPLPDENDPKIRAALDEFGLTLKAVTESNRGIGRNGDTSYSRTFVDANGCLWYMNRQGRLYRIDPTRGFVSELAGALDHPTVWTSISSPFPHGNRIYVRTFGRLVCIGEK